MDPPDSRPCPYAEWGRSMLSPRVLLLESEDESSMDGQTDILKKHAYRW
jgi:hypothetical protein